MAQKPSQSDGSTLGTAVAKTAKMYVGGAFVRGDSGRSYPVQWADGSAADMAALATRKDVRDAVAKARAAQGGWAGATAYNRGQVLYRVAEVMQGRSDQFAELVSRGEGLKPADAEAIVAATIARWVWFAGWSDKLAQVAGAANPVAGPYFNLSSPEPTGVVGIVAPQDSSLLGLSTVVAAAIVSGNTSVVLASTPRPHPAVALAEVLATSDVPGGVVNILTGPVADLAPTMVGHEDVNALDLCGAPKQMREAARDWEASAAQTIKRVLRPQPDHDWMSVPNGPARILALCETKTVWHPKGR